MRQRERILIHDKPVSFALMGMFFLSFLIVLNVIHIRNKQVDADIQLEKQHYTTNSVYLYDAIASEEEVKKLDFQRLDITKGNVVIVFNAVVGNGYSVAPIHLVSVMNEPLAEEVKDGRFPMDNEIEHGRKCVVIGEGLKRLTEKTQEGEVLRIDGTAYDVMGILKDISGDGTDNRVLVFQNCSAEALLNGLDGSYSYCVEYGSNVESELQTDRLLAWLHYSIPNSKIKKTTDDQIDSLDDMRTMAQLLHRYIRFVLYGLFAFCMIGCLIVSTIWIRRRRKEIFIRKALGSGMGVIGIVLLRDLGIMMGMALLMSGAVILLQSLLSNEAWLREEYIFRNLLCLSGAALLTIIITFVRPFYTASKINPAEGVRE
ncbi:MAG: ABC transporter permease [Clostridiales bacterium]|nr:ABC transporter permease [Clostridiales bacterium]